MEVEGGGQITSAAGQYVLGRGGVGSVFLAESGREVFVWRDVLVVRGCYWLAGISLAPSGDSQVDR